MKSKSKRSSTQQPAKTSKKKSPKNSKSPTPRSQPTWEEVVVIVDNIMRSLGRKFRFGYYTPEELTQEAYILAWECVPRWDGERPLAAFIYTHLHNQLYNVKRKKYERIEPPCTNCPLDAYKNKTCTAYNNLEDCKYYSQWLSRNAIKRNLMNLGSIQDGIDYVECTHTDAVELRDLYEYTFSFLEPDERMQIEEDQSLSLDQINKIRNRMGLPSLNDV